MKAPRRVLRWTPLALAAALLACLVLEQSRTSVAYALTGYHWPTATASYRVNPNFVDAPAGSPSQQIAALQRGASEWHSAGQIPFEFHYAGTSNLNTVAPNDGTNVVFYSHTDGGGALATTTYSFQSNGNLVGFDMVYYDRSGTFDFVWARNPTVSQFDIEGVAVHEFGHALGMGHSAVTAATMFPSVSAGVTALRTLHADDIAGVQSIYGIQATGTPTIATITPPYANLAGAARIVITGTELSGGDPQLVTFDGLVATDITVVDDTRIECNLPLGTHSGWVDVSVSHAQGSVDRIDGFFNTCIETVQPLSISAPGQFRVTIPADAGRPYEAFFAYGFQIGIPCNAFGSPSDLRVIPINDDPLFRAVRNNDFPQNFANLQGFLNGVGTADYWAFMPPLPSLVGFFLCTTVITLDPAMPSGIRNIAEADVLFIQP